MTVTFRAVGTRDSQQSNTNVSPGLPAGLTAGDMMLLVCAWGVTYTGTTYPTSSDRPTGPESAGWTHLITVVGGVDSPGESYGVDAGKRALTVWYKEAGSSESAPTLNSTSSANSAVTSASISAFITSLGAWVTPVAVGGEDKNKADAWSVTMGSDPGFLTGDMALHALATVPDTTNLTQALTWPGVSSPSSDIQTGAQSQGNDVRFNIRRTQDSANGTSSGAPSLGVSTTGAAGAAVIVRLRDVAPPTDLTANDSTHGHAAESPTVTQVHEHAPADALHGHTAEAPAFTQAHELVTVDSTHSHTAESPTLATVHVLAADDAAHGHTVDAPTLTQAHALTAADSTHAHVGEEPTLTQVHALGAPDDSAHGHAVESPTLTQVHALTGDDSTHGHTAESPNFTSEGTLTPADSTHGHTVQSPTLTQLHELGNPDDSTHGHTGGVPTITQAHDLSPAGGGHGHTADAPAITQAHVMAAAGAIHDHAADEPTFATASATLTPASATHAHTATIPAFHIVMDANEYRVYVVEAERRTLLVRREPRTLDVPVESRTITA